MWSGNGHPDNSHAQSAYCRRKSFPLIAPHKATCPKYRAILFESIEHMLIPRQDYIVVKPIPRVLSELLTIITAETDQGSDGAEAEIIAVGPGKRNKRGNIMPMDAKPGDQIVYGGKGLGCIKFPTFIADGQEYILIQEADICFVKENHAA